jgi:hypothetical protein
MRKARQSSRSKREKKVAKDGTSYFLLTLDDCHLLFNALKQYKPSSEEQQLYDLWLESFDEEIFVHEGSSEGFPVN